jgi:hypothetical protein
LLSLESAQRAYLGATHRMHARRSVLHPSHVKQPAFEINLIPSQNTQFRCPKTVTVPDKDHRRITVPVATTAACGFHKQSNFLDIQVLPWPALVIRRKAGRHCPVFGAWPPSSRGNFHMEKYRLINSHSPILGSFRDSSSYHTRQSPLPHRPHLRGRTTSSLTIDGLCVPHRTANTPALSALKSIFVTCPRLSTNDLS